ncbi:hypothetical protein ACJDU8_24345 [Clostridium sp. WILCCON 0269]|uniref:Uncharacterized protein n=1 Tax=Candidatus Clostridium eludens TaxID=3381663 RepID=A0ABW8SX53_9CLOT
MAVIVCKVEPAATTTSDGFSATTLLKVPVNVTSLLADGAAAGDIVTLAKGLAFVASAATSSCAPVSTIVFATLAFSSTTI